MDLKNLNPCERERFWSLVKWLSDDCQCCAIVRTLAVGAGAGLIIGSPLHWKIDFVIGAVLLAIGVLAAWRRTPMKDEEEDKR